MKYSSALLKAEAAKAEREAQVIFAKLESATKLDRYGSRPLIPAGLETEAERASDLMRRARVLTAEAAGMRPMAAEVAPQYLPAVARDAKSLGISTVKSLLPLETADTVAARILNSDSVAPGPRLVTSAPRTPGAADTVESLVARILRA